MWQLTLLCLSLTGLRLTGAAPSKFSTAIQLGHVSNHVIDEASGIASSRDHPGVLYTQNDKGDSSRIFAIDGNNGNLLAILTIANVQNYDWEDLAVGVCPGGGHCIYIAETGDHGGDGSRNIIFRVREPGVIRDQTLQVDAQLHFRWNQTDCETVMVDPTGVVYIASKVNGGRGLLAQLPATGWGGQTVDIGPSAYLPIRSTHNDPVGGDISPNGKEMLIKTREHVYYWEVPNGDYIGAVSHFPVDLPYTMEHRGEAVCWSPRADGYFTLGEGTNEPLYYYRRL